MYTQPVKTYSSGMFVKGIGFAVAINIDPEILIVDEALSVGDVFLRQSAIISSKNSRSRERPFFVSHDLSAISKYRDRGRLPQSGRKAG